MSRARLSKTKQLESFYLKNAKETMKNSIQHAINLYSIGTIVQYNTAKDLLNNLTSNKKFIRNTAINQLNKITADSQDKTIKSVKLAEKI